MPGSVVERYSRHPKIRRFNHGYTSSYRAFGIKARIQKLDAGCAEWAPTPDWQTGSNCRNRGFALIDPILSSIEQAIGNWCVGVDSAVAKEGPVAANVFEGLQVDVADQNFLAVVGGFGQDATEGIAEK